MRIEKLEKNNGKYERKVVKRSEKKSEKKNLSVMEKCERTNPTREFSVKTFHEEYMKKE
jgi:hypothetical protein